MQKIKTKTLDSRSKNLIMVGYGVAGYRLFDTIERKIVYARDVIFVTQNKLLEKTDAEKKKSINLQK